jgi:hypothetical protein
MLIFIILVSIVFVLGVMALALSYSMSAWLLNPPRQPITRTPGEYGLHYEDVEFKSTDGINLKGWFIPGKSNNGNNRIIIFAHAMSFNRHGWSAKSYRGSLVHQPDVDFLPFIKALNESGNAILMFDLGNHGESDGRAKFGAGLDEYRDIVGAVNYINNRYHQDSPQIGLMGACGGANSIVIAMSKAKEHMGRLRFLVLIQPISPHTVIHGVMKVIFGRLGSILVPMTIKFYRWKGGYDLEEASPQKYAKDIEIPTLHIQAKADTWTTLSDVNGIYNEIAGPKELWLIEGKLKRFDTYNYPNSHPEKIIEFAKEHFAVSET